MIDLRHAGEEVVPDSVDRGQEAEASILRRYGAENAAIAGSSFGDACRIWNAKPDRVTRVTVGAVERSSRTGAAARGDGEFMSVHRESKREPQGLSVTGCLRNIQVMAAP
jgi:hypothetical protein